ncbi:glycosyltransferase family 4 protein [Imperialibacter roseus]|uniref:Glycosyltransferase family 4 protein n=1 Tax=Imperialibacter roseus TaxID=1324217 RepID=A0ABZ0IMK7_9BACT|nr:glycosyltransferase family 4 protein [Imperialibacter roseus]WOK06268.1 glycosyltransferase family 4 protein [Imperialibacter roseus]
MNYIALAFLLVLLLLIYFRVAVKVKIFDTPNLRSSHGQLTIRGGGIVFPLSIIVWFFWENNVYLLFTSGLVLISVVSFIDDIHSISAAKRLVFQILAAFLLLYQIPYFESNILVGALALIVCVGWINSFNFMDGINGITALYSLVSLSTFYFLNSTYLIIEPDFIEFVIISGLVFSYFNVRKTASTFAGDIGSVSMAFILTFLLLSFVMATNNWYYILFFLVYGIDAGVTVCERLLRGENIFKPHRTHLYQYLANEKGIPHIRVALIYAGTQLITNVLLVFFFPAEREYSLLVIAGIIFLAVCLYLLLKRRTILSLS